MTYEPLTDESLEQIRALARPLADKPIPELEAGLREVQSDPPVARMLDGRSLTGKQLATLFVDQVRLLQLRRLTSSVVNVAELASRIGQLDDGRVAILSGAGISVDSGFPTFRGGGGAGPGLWEKVNPLELASVDGFRRDPDRSLAWYCSRRAIGIDAVPNLAHAAIAEAADLHASRWAGVHTQNVDGLHEAAGSRNVRRIHGSIWVWRERATRRFVADTSTDPDELPRGDAGRPLWRPGVVMFGDYAPQGVYRRAIDELRSADVAIVVGTAAQVTTFWPLLETVVDARARLIEVNPRPSDVTTELGAVPVQLPAGVGVPLVLETLGLLAPEQTERLARTPRPSLRDRLPTFVDELLADDEG